MKGIKHTGVNLHRIKHPDDNPRESAFASAWQKQNDTGRTLDWIMSGPKNEPLPLSDRDYEVAATVVQWLGSSVGMSFLRNVISSDAEMRNWFK